MSARNQSGNAKAQTQAALLTQQVPEQSGTSAAHSARLMLSACRPAEGRWSGSSADSCSSPPASVPTTVRSGGGKTKTLNTRVTNP